MAYRKITAMDIWEILRRHTAGQSISRIKKALGYDRKSIRKYITLAQKNPDVFNNKETAIRYFTEHLPDLTGRPQKTHTLLAGYQEELYALITDKENPLKSKHAFEVLTERHPELQDVSYSSFKRYAKSIYHELHPEKSTCRIETDPGHQIQIDYCKVGLLFDPVMKKRRVLYAFIGTLSYSRHKYVEFTFKQTQQSFVESHVKMFQFFGGVARTIIIDNLKAGVIKPDLYDPSLNRAYREMAEYYGCFIDPARVSKPKDKPIVERDVQTVRAQFRKMIVTRPSLNLTEANMNIRTWFTDNYGRRKHGTTNVEPMKLFQDIEQSRLMPLPDEPFQPAQWKEATVHPDHYIQVNKKAYSVPHPYVGKKVMVKVTAKTVEIYYNDQLVKMHAIAPPHRYRQTDPADFPPNMQHAINRGLPRLLIEKAGGIGKNFQMLIRNVLEPHAFLNLRRAQGLLSLVEKYEPERIEEAAHIAAFHDGAITPKHFQNILHRLQENHREGTPQLPLSSETQTFIRSDNYYTQQHERKEH